MNWIKKNIDLDFLDKDTIIMLVYLAIAIVLLYIGYNIPVSY